MELGAKGVFSNDIIEEATNIRMSMAIGKTQRNSARHNKLAFIAVHQALIRNVGHVDRDQLAAIFGLSSSDAVRVFTTFSPLQLGINIESVPDTIEGSIAKLCRSPELGLYDDDTVALIQNYAELHLHNSPCLRQYVPYTVAVAILYDFMLTRGIRLQDPNKFYNIVGLRSVTIDTIRRVMRDNERH